MTEGDALYEADAMTIPAFSFSDLNRRNQEFWEKQQERMHERMADPDLLEAAFETLAYEQRRGTPAYSQTIFEAALERAESARRKILSQLGRKGPQARKKDVLS